MEEVMGEGSMEVTRYTEKAIKLKQFLQQETTNWYFDVISSIHRYMYVICSDGNIFFSGFYQFVVNVLRNYMQIYIKRDINSTIIDYTNAI